MDYHSLCVDQLNDSSLQKQYVVWLREACLDEKREVSGMTWLMLQIQREAYPSIIQNRNTIEYHDNDKKGSVTQREACRSFPWTVTGQLTTNVLLRERHGGGVVSGLAAWANFWPLAGLVGLLLFPISSFATHSLQRSGRGEFGGANDSTGGRRANRFLSTILHLLRGNGPSDPMVGDLWKVVDIGNEKNRKLKG